MKTLREKPWYVRVASLLVAVWAVWLLAFVVWGWTIEEWHKPTVDEEVEVSLDYTVSSVLACIFAVSSVFAAIRWPGWGAIGAGLVVTFVAQWVSRDAVSELRHWGEFVDGGSWTSMERDYPWVPLDGLDLVPYWLLLVVGVLLLVGGIVHVVHPAHGTTPHAGAATGAAT